MKELTRPTKIYLIAIYFLGLVLFLWNVLHITTTHFLMVGVLSVLASLFLIFKVEGATNRSHYTFSFLIYGFAFASLSLGETLLVILISNLVEWIWNRPRWFIQLFNTAGYICVMTAAGLVFQLIAPAAALANPWGVLAIAVSMIVFTLLNHFLVGVIVWLARGENFKVSGIFNTFPIMMDLTFLTFGAMLTLVWTISPVALILFLFPLYLIYETLRIPALERKTEIDQKTGLFNHRYFMMQMAKELDRSKRFDRPLSIIMLDLDLLRNINNTYGHLAGDEVLIGIARILKRTVREYDVVARFGGEEFIIMLPEIAVQQALERAEMIRKEIENTEFTVPTSVVPIKATISLGLAERESFTQTAEEIIHNADTALYHSKLNGRNKSFAYRDDAYLPFFAGNPVEPSHSMPPAKDAVDDISDSLAADIFPAAETRYTQAEETPPTSAGASTEGQETSSKAAGRSRGFVNPVYLYISLVAVLALLLFYGLYLFAPGIFHTNWLQIWPGLLASVVLVALCEFFSIDLYIGKTSLSTSAVPILAGTLLFGPLAGVLLCITYTVVVGIKYRSHLNKYIFNFSNQVIAVILYLLPFYLIGKPLADFSLIIQTVLVVMAALIVYLTNTWLISFGMGIDLHQSPRQIWMEQYLWMATIYGGIGLIAMAYIVGYRYEGVLGLLLMMTPLILLRASQKQYVDRTREAVAELREKAVVLEKNAEEINRLNEGLLETLAEIIDLRDPNVLGHSKRVTSYAVKLAEKMGLNPKQVRLIHKAGLLHDLGKLGVPLEILKKPGKLTPSEYQTVTQHAEIGANLVRTSPSLQSLVPIIRHHHESYDGNGYPDKLAGNQIPIEARIVCVADAVDAMISDRPQRKRLPKEKVIEELKACSGTQFDPLVVRVAIRLLEKDIEPASGKFDH